MKEIYWLDLRSKGSPEQFLSLEKMELSIDNIRFKDAELMKEN
jgi:hypothetical protein